MIVGVGIDIVELARIREMLDRHGERFLRRVLAEGEEAYCRSQADPVPHVGGRWAAKEAAVKAFGTGFTDGIGWRDVEVVREASGQPRLRFHGRAAELIRDRGITVAHVSLAHDRSVATAIVVLEVP